MAMMILETNSRPLDVKLLATRFRLLNALETPVTFVFGRIEEWKGRIQGKLNERGWPDETACPEWREEQARKRNKRAGGAR
jgi:hypothetical protein